MIFKSNNQTRNGEYFCSNFHIRHEKLPSSLTDAYIPFVKKTKQDRICHQITCTPWKFRFQAGAKFMFVACAQQQFFICCCSLLHARLRLTIWGLRRWCGVTAFLPKPLFGRSQAWGRSNMSQPFVYAPFLYEGWCQLCFKFFHAENLLCSWLAKGQWHSQICKLVQSCRFRKRHWFG